MKIDAVGFVSTLIEGKCAKRKKFSLVFIFDQFQTELLTTSCCLIVAEIDGEEMYLLGFNLCNDEIHTCRTLPYFLSKSHS